MRLSEIVVRAKQIKPFSGSGIYTRFIMFVILLAGITITCHSQGIKPTNVYRVTVTSRYVLENGERTSTFYAVNQEISDSLGRMHTEIDYDWETRYPNNYRWHFFDSMLHVRTDYFKDEQLDRRVVYHYNSDTTVFRENHYRLQGEDTVLFMTLNYSLNSDGLPEQIEAVNDSGRRLYRIRSRFDDNGIEVRRRVTGRRDNPDDGVRRLDREAAYDSLGMLLSETVQLRMADRSRRQYNRRYEYDENQNITEILEMDDEGNQVSRTEYVWQPRRNRLQRIISYDAGNNLEKFLGKRYEIYRTTDRRQRVIDY